jgi:hypothetical protein
LLDDLSRGIQSRGNDEDQFEYRMEVEMLANEEG